MSEPLEALAAELCVDAGGAFGKLQGSVTSQLMVPLERDGKTEQLPITTVRNFVFDPDPLCASGRIEPNRPAGNRFARPWPPA